MSDYLRKRFPLAGTSTVYMSGKSLYNLVRHDRPGIIASVELLPGDAIAFDEAVRNALADAWFEGADAAVQGYDLPDAAQIHNPYIEQNSEGNEA